MQCAIRHFVTSPSLLVPSLPGPLNCHRRFVCHLAMGQLSSSSTLCSRTSFFRAFGRKYRRLSPSVMVILLVSCYSNLPTQRKRIFHQTIDRFLEYFLQPQSTNDVPPFPRTKQPYRTSFWWQPIDLLWYSRLLPAPLSHLGIHV